ncbi:hypothetical protein [Paraliobacillus salinarum]|uniref:hypothetical protein n=1 Tax=Paraliobacillus salinarum TaxID=1158996 RepID=UPI0015F6D0BD|nr:hypothetical protein [Paraliobacillus salinarum]
MKKKLNYLILILMAIFFITGCTSAEDAPTEEETTPQEVSEEETNAAIVDDPEEMEASEELTYTYKDFKGTYVNFEGEPYESPIGMSHIIVLGDDFFQSFNRWDFDMTSTILDKTVEGNVLTLDLDSDKDEQWGFHSESGTEQFKLRYEDDKKIMHSIANGQSLYSMSSQDLQTHYNQSEIDYARIILTINGAPSLDQWLLWEDPVVNINHSSAGDPVLQIDDDIVYPEEVTHLSSTVTDSNHISYTSNRDGYITIYPNPSHYQAAQSEEENRQLAQEVLDNAYTIYVEPFDPYTVADFIGRVEFIDE